MTTVLKAIPRESCCRRLLTSRNFGDSSEITSVVSWNTDCARINKVCKIVVFFCWLDYTITSEEILKSTFKADMQPEHKTEDDSIHHCCMRKR